MRKSEYTVAPSNHDITGYDTSMNDNDEEEYGEEFEILHKQNAKKF